MSKSSARSHREKHISRQLATSMKIKEELHSIDLLNTMTNLFDTATRIMKKAEKDNRMSTALQAIRESRGCIETMSKLVSTLKEIQKEDDQKQKEPAIKIYLPSNQRDQVIDADYQVVDSNISKLGLLSEGIQDAIRLNDLEEDEKKPVAIFKKRKRMVVDEDDFEDDVSIPDKFAHLIDDPEGLGEKRHKRPHRSQIAV